MDITTLSSYYSNCLLCHRQCGINRSEKTGYCGMPDGLFAARAALHCWEEPCISGAGGSGTVFFSGCSLRCVHCQNHDIALGLSGKEITPSRLAEIFLNLQEKGAANINLVTPTHYVPSIIAALSKAKDEGLTLPVVYNTGNYETLDTLKMLEGYVDVYLPDFKYWSGTLSGRYSAAPDYAVHAAENIAEMFRQVGEARFSAIQFPSPQVPKMQLPAAQEAAPQLVFPVSMQEPSTNYPTMQSPGAQFPTGQFPVAIADEIDPSESETCLMTRGIIVRHLVLPGAVFDSKKIIRFLYKTYGDAIYLSILNQYTPIAKNLGAFPELNRKITQAEYNGVVDYAIKLGVENAFIQEGETAEESFIPEFNGEGI
ncbi:MAG: 4Fe-4S cluster-binding domain-containing protein [Lachnospiraceae bacterium]|nr:4Fe-4S cluster-binding domain-containing protein [Lachnospiraceae bacterium]